MTWTVDRSKILQPDEMRRVLEDLHRKARRSVNTRMNLIVFRLSACCGLRASEISKLILADVQVDNTQPKIRIRCEVGKGHKRGVVPLTWDAGTLNDIRAWKQFRREQGADESSLFICSQHRDTFGRRLDRRNLRMRFKFCCKVLGCERRNELTIHDGRHSFVSHALHGGRSIVEVKSAARHSNLSSTSIYTHMVDDSGQIGDLFDFS